MRSTETCIASFVSLAQPRAFTRRANIFSHISTYQVNPFSYLTTFSQIWYTMEPLSGAASVISVASLAIQICKELKKLHDFWQSVEEAPNDIASISAELKLFITWLTVIAKNYQRQNSNYRSFSEAAATDTLKLCLATVHDMGAGVRDLQNGIAKGTLSRRWASIKFVFRKDKREKSMAQIEQMKSLIIIAQTCYLA